MGRFRASVAIALVPAAAMALVACDDLLGLGDFERVACKDTCPETGSPVDAGGAFDEGGALAEDHDVSPFDGAVAATDGAWARWQMPNPDGGADAGWPNVVSYAARGGGVIHDNVTHLDWALATLASAESAEHGAAYCAGIGFRLPTRIELASLIDFTRPAPPTVDPIFGNAPAGAYWTSSPTPVDGGFWVVDFDDGTVSQTTFGASRAVRCVRGPTP